MDLRQIYHTRRKELEEFIGIAHRDLLRARVNEDLGKKWMKQDMDGQEFSAQATQLFMPLAAVVLIYLERNTINDRYRNVDFTDFEDRVSRLGLRWSEFMRIFKLSYTNNETKVGINYSALTRTINVKTPPTNPVDIRSILALPEFSCGEVNI